MKLIDNNNITDPSVNLAIEEYCVRNLETYNENYLLFYINEPSIIIGKHQNTVEEINAEYVKANNIHVVRRISGGGTVYHDKGNLNFSFITKYSHESIHNFKKFTGPVIETLSEMGINAELNGRNDITIDGRKISGNAQFSNTKSMFSHGTLLFDSKLDDVVSALNVKTDKIESKGIKSVRSRVANIKEFLSSNINVEDLKKLLTRNIFKEYDELPVYRLSDKEWESIHKLAEEKYRRWDWNYGRSPEFNIQKVRRFDLGQIDVRIHVKDGVIEKMKIYGDFLGHGEVSELEDTLSGVKYNRESIAEVLGGKDIQQYFGGLNEQEFNDLLLD